jgi:hypothetical protein
LRRLGLVFAACLFLAVVGGGFAFRRARAQVGEGLMDLGAQMMRFARARHQDAPRDLMLNGQRIGFSSGTADLSADDVLDFFEARCADADGGLEEQVASLRGERPEAFPAERSASPTLREGDERGGYVACIDFGQSLEVSELGERLASFGRSGDVGDLGEVRFVFAEYDDASGSTHFVAMWTAGSFDLNRMFPERGDAPGRDAEGVSRPAGSRRVLSGWERGQPYSLAVYQTREDEAALERFYRRALTGAGWTLLETHARVAEHATGADLARDAGPARGPSEAPRVLFAERGERMVTVVFSTDVASGHASAAVLEGP